MFKHLISKYIHVLPHCLWFLKAAIAIVSPIQRENKSAAFMLKPEVTPRVGIRLQNPSDSCKSLHLIRLHKTKTNHTMCDEFASVIKERI